MTRVRLVLHQFSFDYKTYIREPQALFFTAFLPLMFLVLFVGVFGNEDIPLGNGRVVTGATYFVPSILAMAVISATAVNLAISIAIARDRGTLKRLRATPLPPSVYLIARLLTQVITVTIISTVVIAFGRVTYGVNVPASAWPPLLLTLAVGISSFCAVGFLLTVLIRSEQAGGAVVNAIVLPLQFMSGIFFPRGSIPEWMRTIASFFPIKHLVDALLSTFNPANTGPQIASDDLLVLGAWGVVSLIVAARFFRWTPANR
jgi:ABC-2 type transport system permease protein